MEGKFIMTTEYTFEDLYQALQKLSKEERSLLPLSNLQFFDSIETGKELARAYERPAAILYKLSGLLQNPAEQRLLQSDVEQIEQKEEVAPEKQKESLIDKFYKPYKSSAASAWYKA